MRGTLLLVCVVAAVVGSGVCWNFGDIISEDTRTRVNQDQALFECKILIREVEYWWAFDEIYKHFKKYSEMGKLSFNTKLAIMSASIRRIFRHRTAVGFYLVRQLKDREILELGPLHTLDVMPPAFIEYDQGVIGRAWASRDMVFIQNATEARNSFPDDFHFYPHPTSELAVPVIDKDTDKVVAVYYHALEHDHSYQHMDFLGVRTLINLIEWVVADEEDTPDSCNIILKNNLLPLLFCQQVTNPYLKYKLIMVLKSYLLVLDQEVLVPYCSPANGDVKIIALLVAPVLQAWQTDNSTLPLPLTFAVLVLLPQLLSAVESLKSSVAPGLSQLVGCYLDFINKVESESIIDALQQLTVCLKNDIQPHLLSIISTLCAQWQKANSAQTAADAEKKTDTRSMVLGSIKSLLKAVDKIPADLGESISALLIQHIAIPIFSVVPQDDEKLDADDVLVILNLVMHRSKSCPPSIEQFFPVISACLGPHQAQSVCS